MSDYCKLSRLEMHILSTFAFAMIIFVIVLADSFICIFWFHSAACETKSSRRALQIFEAKRSVVLESFAPINEAYGADHDYLLPPINITVEERITWFKKKLSELDIFNSTRITQQFDARIREFLDDHTNCKVQFFMTWIAPPASFRRREFFVIESIFKAHPTACLIILSKTLDSALGRMILKPLLDIGYRVTAVTPDLSSLFKNTPAEAWFNDILSGNKDPGEVPLPQNLSNLIRLVVLYKYGGVYLVSRVVERLATNMTIQEYNFTVLPPMAFYPVDWTRIHGFFVRPSDPIWAKAKLRQLSGETYGVHLWNRQSSRAKIEKGSIIATLISDHCIICQDVDSSWRDLFFS